MRCMAVLDFQIDQYLGCFYDRETQLEDPSRSHDFSNAALTIDICISHCRRANTAYAILQVEWRILVYNINKFQFIWNIGIIKCDKEF